MPIATNSEPSAVQSDSRLFPSACLRNHDRESAKSGEDGIEDRSDPLRQSPSIHSSFLSFAMNGGATHLQQPPPPTLCQQPPPLLHRPSLPEQGTQSQGRGGHIAALGNRAPVSGSIGPSFQCQSIHQDHICSNDSDKSEDSSSPKRQRLSHSVFDYTVSSPTASPPVRPWEMTSNRQPPLARSNQHHFSGEHCSTPARNRRSPPVHRQRARRDLLSRHNSISQDENYRHLSYGQQQAIEDPQTFHPPNISHHMFHPAAHPPQQNSMMVDIHDQVRAC
ncbi:uncharacterized protein LOC121062956 [Cygnus olor]|uniref:uncharacterized protein LOC121062956 n=1 Tax=Cygnus olor TaxID=8869 RepID=UPI001ADEB63A|nr:uncharacterized protein LOC121062956 [Cygnus olor]